VRGSDFADVATGSDAATPPAVNGTQTQKAATAVAIDSNLNMKFSQKSIKIKQLVKFLDVLQEQ
jgi:azurin